MKMDKLKVRVFPSRVANDLATFQPLSIAWDQKRHGNLFPSSQGLQPSRIDFLVHSPKLLECDMLQAHGSKWPVTQMTDKNDGRWKMPCDICDFVKTRYVWMIFDESRKKLLCVFFKSTCTILILEKVIDMLASKHRKNLTPNFACLVFLISAKYCKNLINFWSTKPPSTG